MNTSHKQHRLAAALVGVVTPDLPWPSLPRRPAKRLLALVATAILSAGAIAVAPATSPSDPSAPATAPTTAPAAAFPAALRQRLIGRWLRPDGGYVLTIQSVAESGKASAEYANPAPIHVSRALLANRDGQTLLFVELRDRGYPGNFYALRYDPDQDQLAGVYHHLGLGQTFDVSFERLREEVSDK